MSTPASGGPTGPQPHHHCSDCGLMFDSAASLQVHLHYHQEAMMSRASWGPPATSSPTDNDNNNHVKKGPGTNTIAAADSSDNQPPTPTPIKQEPQQHVYHAASPYDLPQQHQHQQYSPSYGYDVYYGLENPYMNQDFMGKHNQHQQQQQVTRYQPYQHSPRVSSSSPASPVQCDKCGMVCETATQLQEHALTHTDAFHYPPMPAPVKDSSSEILDLDSHKVVYPSVLPSLQSLQGMQPQWQETQQQLYQPAFPQSASQDVKLFPQAQTGAGLQAPGAGLQASHPPHMVSPPDFPTTTTQDPSATFRPSVPQITSTHPVAPGGPKGPGWKSNEARRPKTYNCTACNKWFTSSGHLKRHYNTTLHKNAVKSSGQPDPANLPISAHHHPGRDPNHPTHGKGGVSPTRRGLVQPQQQQRSPEPQGFPPQNQGYLPHAFSTFSFPGIPPDTGQPPPPSDHQQQQQQIDNNTSHQTTTNHHGSPPNGQAGPSVLQQQPSRGLQIHSTLQQHQQQQHHINNSNITAQEGSTYHTQQVQSLISYRRPPRPRIPTPLTTGQEVNSITSQEDRSTSTLFLVIPPGTNSHRTTGDDVNNVVNDSVNAVALRTHYPSHMSEYGHMEHPPFSPAIPDQEPANPSSPQPRVSSTEDIKPVIHRCEACDKMFNKACYLTQHNRSFHSGDKPFKCGRCGKRFRCGVTHEEHIAKHAGEKPFKCAQCPKQFNHKTDLRRHMCLHSGSKPFPCHVCGKGFIRKDHMLKHCETHSKKPREIKRQAAKQA